MNATQVKICGLTRSEDAALALELGAWALGFIFYEKSARFVLPSLVKNVLRDLNRKGRDVRTFGVFVNPTLEQLKSAVSVSGVNTIQLHGSESAEFCASVRETFPQLKIAKVFRLGDSTDTPLAHENFDYQLVDSATSDAWGGTGIVVDWAKAADLRGKPLILAGGLTPENAAQAIAIVKPYALDVSSGVESSPGIKSEQKLKSFFKAVKDQQNE